MIFVTYEGASKEARTETLAPLQLGLACFLFLFGMSQKFFWKTEGMQTVLQVESLFRFSVWKLFVPAALPS